MAADAQPASPIMDEARRFIRHVIPGLVFFVQMWLYYCILDRESALFAVSLQPGAGWLGAGVGLAFASVGVGFLLSTIHHALYWRLPLCSRWRGRFGAIDHAVLLGDAVKAGLLSLCTPGGERWRPGENVETNLSVRGAWRLVARMWHERSYTVEPIRSSAAQDKSLFDLMHSLGACLWGSIVAALMAFWLKWPCRGSVDTLHWIVFAVVALAMMVTHWGSYRVTREHAKGFFEGALLDSLFWSTQNQQVLCWPVLRQDETRPTSITVLRVRAKAFLARLKCMGRLAVAFGAKAPEDGKTYLDDAVAEFGEHVRSLDELLSRCD